MRTLFVGDVHGCCDELMSLCRKIDLQKEDHLYFVWDLINKWPKSLEVIEFIRNRPNTWSVIGNHEYFLLTHHDDFDPDMMTPEIERWRQSSSFSRIDEFQTMLAPYKDWILSLPHIIERDNFILVHAGLHPDHGVNTPLEIATLLRIYDGKPWYEYYSWEKLVFYWHWAAEGLRIRTNTIWLDTGCCFGWALTAYCLETWEIWQVRANFIYKEPAHWKK
jgi:serine/threonine protein phosphatase 1